VRWFNVLLLVLLLVGGAALVLLGDGSRAVGPRPEQEATAPGPEEALRPEPLTGMLLIRLRTSDGREVPKDAQAGYVRFGTPRLRKPAKDGTFPFTDAPVGRLDVTAQAAGWVAETVTVNLVPGVAAEAVITLTAAGAPKDPTPK